MALIQTAKLSVVTTGATITISLPNTTSPGNLIVVGYGDDLGGVGQQHLDSISDNLGNTYNIAADNGSGSSYSSIWYAKNIIPGATTLTLHVTAGAQGGDASIIVREYNNIITTNPFDTGAGNNGTSTSVSSNLTNNPLAQNNELLIGYVCTNFNGEGYTAGSGWGNLEVETSSIFVNSAMEDQSTVAGGQPVATFTLSNAPSNWACNIVTFRNNPLPVSFIGGRGVHQPVNVTNMVQY